MEIGISVLVAFLAGAFGSGLFWIVWGWLHWRAWLAVALPMALFAYLILYGPARLG